MNKRQAKKYKIKNVVDRMVNATTNSTVEKHKSGKINNAKRIKHHTSVSRKNKLNKKIARKIKLNKKITKPAPEPTKPAKDTEPPLAFGRRVEIKSHRTRAEYLSQAREGFINQFMDRLIERFPDAPQDEVAEIHNWLLKHDYVSISHLLKDLDDEYKEMYYESSSTEYKEGKSMEDFINDFLEAANEYDGEINEDFD